MARKVIAEFDAIDGPFINKLNAIDRSVTRFEVGTLSAFGRVEKGLNGLLASAARLQNVSGIVAGGFGAQIAAQYIDQATRIRRSLKEAGDDSQEAFEKAFLAAQRSLSGFEAFTQGVQRMSKATGQAFDDSLRDMETLNKLLVLGGKTTQERMSTMIQFSQALQAGVLQGEELRSLRENAPIELIRAIASEAGGGIEDLKKFGEQGALTLEVMMRALKSLEDEADLRMRGVTITISEAATVLGNAGIVAVEAFDRGLGLSRATTAGLVALGNVLGQSAEAAELFGRALQIAGAGLLAAFAGRKISDAIAGQQAFAQGLKSTAAATAAAEKAAAAALLTSQQRVQALRAEVAALIQKGAAEKAVAAAQSKLAAAQAGLATATSRYTMAVGAASVAQERLAFTSRALAAAGSTVRAAWAFLGGWPGLLLTAGTAFFLLRDSAESAADRFARLTSETGEATSAADALRDVQSRLNEAIEAAGEKATVSSQRILAATKEEYEAKKKLLELEMQRLAQTQFERVNEIVGLRDEQNDMRGRQQGILDYYNSLPEQEKILQADGLQQSINDLSAGIDANEAKIIELRASHEEAARIIAENNVILGQSFEAVGASAGQAAIPDEALAKYEELLAKKQAEIGLQQLINQYGAESAQVAEYRAAAERSAYEEVAKTNGITGDLLVSLMAAYDQAVALGAADVSSGISAANSQAAALAQNLGISLATARALSSLGPQGVNLNPDPSGQVYSGRGGDPRSMGGSALDWQVRQADEFLRNWKPPSVGGGSGGGGGGGGGAGRDLDREALQLIESMMTAEEKRAAKIKEATELRAALVEKYGEESEMVQQVDEAMQRMNETLEEGNSLQEQFWGTMSDYIAQSIDDWRGWGNFVKGILASFVQKYGEDFFTALFTPGQQSGDGLGTFLGNALTGGFKSAAFAPKSAMAPGADLASRAAAIGKIGASLPSMQGNAGDQFTIINNNDFRGVDNASREYINGRLNQLEKSIPNKAVAAVKDAKRKRILK